MYTKKEGLTMMSFEPCPFCGGKLIRTEVNNIDKVFRIYCCSDDDCAAEVRVPFEDIGIGHGECFSFIDMLDIFDKMKRLWNKREGV